MNYSNTLLAAAKQSMDQFINRLDELIELDEQEALLASAGLFRNLEFVGLVQSHFVLVKDALDGVISKSYYHKNGFDKVVLFEGKNFKVRVHNFHPSTTSKAMEHVHDHRWAFASTILRGSFESEFFAETPSGDEGLISYRYFSDKSKGSFSVQRLGNARLARISTVKYEQGDTYLLGTDELHRICRVSSEGATSVIITGKARRETCKLYSKSPFQGEVSNLQKLEERPVLSIINSLTA